MMYRFDAFAISEQLDRFIEGIATESRRRRRDDGGRPSSSGSPKP